MLVSDFDFVMIQCMVHGLLIVGRLVVVFGLQSYS